ncbi:MAG: argininosuccinate lyase [Thermoleophilia bacterium]
MWGGRFSEEQAPLFERMNASIGFDHVLAPYDLLGSRAHVRMLGRIGVLDEAEVTVLLAGLEEILDEVRGGEFHWSLQDEDIHMAVERRLTEIVGPVGGKLHTGRSRNDQVAVDTQLYLREAVRGHLKRLRSLAAALIARARAQKTVVIPGYTHLQRAQPVLLAHHLLSYVAVLERDAERLLDWHRRGRLPLGAGALAGVAYAVDRDYLAEELGFEAVAWNAMDAVGARDWALEYAASAAACALNLSRLAEEIVLWSSQEFAFLRLPDSWSSGSSIMPQKRNPDGAELVRAKAAGFLARLTGLAALLKGLPLAYNKDLQEDKLYLFATRKELDICLEAMTAMVEVMEIDAGRALEAAEGGYVQATDVADFLVDQGVAFREAHRIAGRLVALAAEQKKPLAALSPEELRSVSDRLDDRFYAVVDLDRVIASKISAGGTAPARVEEQLEEAERLLVRLDEATGGLPAPREISLLVGGKA